jgi:hypothetical protein
MIPDSTGNRRKNPLDRRWFGLIDLGVADLCATVPPLRGRRSEGERRKKPAAPVGMTEKTEEPTLKKRGWGTEKFARTFAGCLRCS